MGPDRGFPVARDNLSRYVPPAGAWTGFKSFPHFRDPALKPYHRLRENPDPAPVGFSRGFPDGIRDDRLVVLMIIPMVMGCLLEQR